MPIGEYLRDPGRLVRTLQWKRLYAGPRKDVTVESWNGRLTFDSADSFIGRHLCIEGSYERSAISSATAWLEANGYIKPNGGGTLIDVGANIGMITTTLLGQKWFEKSVCFEPLPANMRLLRINIKQNGLTSRVTAMNFALSVQAGEYALEVSATDTGDNRIRLPGSGGALPGAYGEQHRKEIRVPVDTLDHALVGAGVSPGDAKVIWMDIQGHEAKCLEGAPKTLSAKMPVVLNFWPYGLYRAGTTRLDFMALLTRRFTSAHRVFDGHVETMPVAGVDRLFDVCAGHDGMCMLVLTA